MTDRTCQTCRGKIREDDTCNCWCLLAMNLQRLLAVGHDESADLAMSLWKEKADKELVWSGEFDATHVMIGGG